MTLTITISGLHGTGKTTYARLISKDLGLRHISAGDLFRQLAKNKRLSVFEFSQIATIKTEIDYIIDERTKKEAEKGDVIIDALLAAWMAKDFADIKIHLTASHKVRIERIANREHVSFKEAEEATMLREKIERERFKRVYSIDIDDNSIYDLVLNTGLLPLQANVRVIKKLIVEYIKNHGRD